MRSSVRLWFCAAALLALLGCQTTATQGDAGAPEDAHGIEDARGGADARGEVDVGRVDAGEVDAGAGDAGAGDAGADDAGADAGPPDAGPTHPTDLDILAIGVFGPADHFLGILDTWGTVTPQNDPDLTSALLRSYDLVVFGVIPNMLSTPERAALGSWVSIDGGRAIVIGGQARDRTTTHSITSALAMPLDLTATEDFTGTPAWFGGHVGGITIAPPPMSAAHNLGTGSDARVVAEAVGGTNLVVAARFTSTVGGGRAYAWLDAAVTLDPFWSADYDVFWGDVLSWVTR